MEQKSVERLKIAQNPYELEMVNKMRKSQQEGGPNVKINPNKLWDVLREQGVSFYTLPGVKDFIAFAPIDPYVPGDRFIFPLPGEDGVHFVVAPKTHEPKTPEEVEAVGRSEWEALFNTYILPCVDSGMTVGWNSQLDTKRWGASQTWGKLHIHFLRFPRFAKKLESFSTKQFGLREKFSSTANDFLSWWYKDVFPVRISSQTADLDGVKIVSGQKYPKGGIIFDLGEGKFTGEQLHKFILGPTGIIHSYRAAHFFLFRSLFGEGKYYQALIQRGEVDLELHNEPNIIAMQLWSDIVDAAQKPASDEMARSLKALLRILRKGSFSEKVKKDLIKVPAYTITMRRDENGHFLVILSPHIFRHFGIPETLGIAITRHNSEKGRTTLRTRKAHKIMKALGMIRQEN